MDEGERLKQQMERQLAQIGRAIGEATKGMDVCFALLLFEANASPTGWSSYISNAERATMVQALREAADRLERRLDAPPHSQN